jgi:uncharacterized RDD family membrane protein YckC
MADGYPPPPPGWFAFHPPPPQPRLAAAVGTRAYHVLSVARRGATPGGRVVGCRVVALGTARWPSLPKALARHAVAVLLSGYIDGLGYLWTLWDPARPTLHDKVCDTVVVEA